MTCFILNFELVPRNSVLELEIIGAEFPTEVAGPCEPNEPCTADSLAVYGIILRLTYIDDIVNGFIRIIEKPEMKPIY